MSSINSDILGLAKSITEKLEQPSDSDLEFEIKSPRKKKTKVEHIFRTPELPPFDHHKEYTSHTPVEVSLEKMDSEKEEESETDKIQKASIDKSSTLPSQFSSMKQTNIRGDNFMSLEDISDEEELWLIMAPKDCKLKKQSVEMEGRNELKGGKFEIEFFRSELENNMVTLVCDENEKLVSGPHFKGCVQISEKLQTFSPKYHDIVKKENVIPSGLKQRYVPFGADIEGVRFRREIDTINKYKGDRKKSTNNVGFDTVDNKSEPLENTEGTSFSETSPRKVKKEKLKRKHSVIESSDVPAIEDKSVTDSQDTEITLNSETSKKKKKKKRKSHQEDIIE